jgi:hypothetical protein
VLQTLSLKIFPLQKAILQDSTGSSSRIEGSRNSKAKQKKKVQQPKMNYKFLFNRCLYIGLESVTSMKKLNKELKSVTSL